MSRLRNRRLALSAAAGITQRFSQLAAALIILPLVLHSLGLAGFGIWGAATSLAWVAGLLDVGLGGTLVTRIPRALAAGEPASALVSASLYISCGVTFLLLLGCLAAGAAGARTVFLIAGIALALNVPLGLANALWFAVQKGHAAGLWDLGQTVTTLVFLLLAAALHQGVMVMVMAVYLALVLVNLASLVMFFLTHPPLRPGRASRQAWRQSSQGGWQFFLITMATMLGYALDNVLALHWLGADAAGTMTVVMRLVVSASGFLVVATQALWPAFAEAAHSRDAHWVSRALWGGTAGLVALAVAGSAVLFFLGPVLLPLWLGSAVFMPRLLWAAIALWLTVFAIPRVIGLYLNAAGILNQQIVVLLLANFIALAAKYALAPRFGDAGILAATPLVWLLIVCPAYLWWGWQQGKPACS
jgi:O-antigen/teichoic acid export membrane protein